MKIQLIYTPEDQESLMKEAKWYPPMNLMVLGTYLKEAGHDVEILDGQLLSREEISEKINSSLVGISFSCLSTNSQLRSDIKSRQRERGKGYCGRSGGDSSSQGNTRRKSLC